MRQIALPLSKAGGGQPSRIIVGSANREVVDALTDPAGWPFGTAILSGPPRAGKSLLAGWFVASGAGDAIDDADTMAEDKLFHAWNRAQEARRPLLLVSSAGEEGWGVALPDLASRLGAALHLEIGALDDAMLADLILLHAEMRGLALDPAATQYLVPRCRRSHMEVERLVETIDRLSLERKAPPTMAIWRDALEEIEGHKQPRLL